MLIRRFLILTMLFVFSSALADEYRSKANEGYDYYKNGEYDKALEYYKKAGIVKPEEVLPKLGKGSSLYKSNDFDGAEKEFSSIAKSGDKKLTADMQYNIGNAKFKAQDYDGAIKSYIDALKLNPNDRDYKHNLELALTRLQQQQQQKQDKNQQGDKGDQKDQQKQDNKDQNKQKSEQEKQQQADEQDQNKEGDQRQADQQKAKQDSLRQASNEQKMSKDEAEKILARFMADEEDVQKRLKQVNIGRGSGRDW